MANAYTGQDIIKITYNAVTRILQDIADNDVITITYPNDLSTISTGKNGNSLGAHNEQGRIAEHGLRIVKGSDDDKFLNSIISDWLNKSDNFSPFNMEFTKVIKDGTGKTSFDTTDLFFGLPVKQVEVSSNLAGETEQVVSVYNFRYGNSKRSIT